MKTINVVALTVIISLSFFVQNIFSQIYVNEAGKSKIEKYQDNFDLVEGYYQNKKVNLKLRYSGGCAKHIFYYYLKTKSDTLIISIFHNSNSDACETLIEKNISIDIVPYLDTVSTKIILIKNFAKENIAAYRPLNISKLKSAKAIDMLKSTLYSGIDKSIKIKELTTTELWNKMQTQIYSIEDDSIKFYAIHNNKVIHLGGHYSYDLDFVVCDLNKDGTFECIYTYQFGSGVSRGVLGVFANNQDITVDNSCVIPSKYTIAYFHFDKKSDYKIDVHVQSANEKIMQGTLFIEEKLEAKNLKLTSNP